MEFHNGDNQGPDKALLKRGLIQMGLFDEGLAEVKEGNYRYIIRRNPARAKEMASNRASRLHYILKKTRKKNKYLLEHKRASKEVARRDIRREIKKRRMENIVEVEIKDERLKNLVNKETLKEVASLDGCYVIKTDVPDMDKEIIHERYKDLTKVEQAFRTIKTTLEEIRPIYVRKEKRTRGHVFVCMLAYMMVKYMRDNLKVLGFNKKFILNTLEKIEYTVYESHNRRVKIPPDELLLHQKSIIDKLGVKLPHQL